MKIEIKTKNYNVGKRLNDLIEKKLNKLDRYFMDDAKAVVFCKKEKKVYILELTISSKGFKYRSEVLSDNMFENLDNALPKIEKQIIKQNSKKKDLFKQSAFENLAFEFLTDVPKFKEPKIVKTKSFELAPISVNDAIMNMENTDHDFYVFLNKKTDNVNVLYKRKDGELGLIETIV